MLGLIPMKAKFYTALAALGAVFLGWLRLDAKRDQRRTAKIKDYEHAEDIETRVSNDRADPERLHEYDRAGFRD